MRQETLNWLRQAKADLKAAKANLDNGIFYVAAFLSQQCAEKSLKAFLLEKTREIPQTHNLIALGRSAGMPKKDWNWLVELNADYSVARYPDAANGVPAEAYSKESAERKINAAEEIFAWVNKWIGK